MRSISLTRRAVLQPGVRIELRCASSPAVYCKVDDSSGPIVTGDRLVPSTSTFGHAMRASDSTDDSAVIGEALVPFDGGCGLIPVAVTTEQIASMHRHLVKRNRPSGLFYKLLKHC